MTDEQLAEFFLRQADLIKRRAAARRTRTPDLTRTVIVHEEDEETGEPLQKSAPSAPPDSLVRSVFRSALGRVRELRSEARKSPFSPADLLEQDDLLKETRLNLCKASFRAPREVEAHMGKSSR